MRLCSRAMTAMRALTLLSLSVAASVGCTDYPDAVDPYGDPYALLKPGGSFVAAGSSYEISWHRDVRPLVETYCVRCHKGDGIAPMSLETYADTAAHRDAMVSHVESGYMPRWPYDAECHDLAVNRSLSDDQRQVFADWRAADYPAGAQGDYPGPPAKPDFDPAGSDEITLATPAYTPSADGPRCFLLSARVGSDATGDSPGWWVTDMQITPEHGDMVQQATLYLITPGEAGAVPSANDGYACPDGAGTESEVALLAWVPGQGPLSFAQETALLIPTGSRFVMRVRYRVSHLANVPSETTAATLWRYEGRRAPSLDQIRMFSVRAGGATPVERFLPHSQRIIGVVPEMTSSGQTLTLEYMTGPVGTCLGRSSSWDARFSETLLFAEDRSTFAIFGNRTRLGCTFGDGNAATGCRATIIGSFPRFDSIQPLGRTCSGVHECLSACSGSSSCLIDCIGYEQPACHACAREQLFDTCAAMANETQHQAFAACENERCGALSEYDPWLQCMLTNCKSELDIIAAALESELPKGSCNRPEEPCVYVPVGP